MAKDRIDELIAATPSDRAITVGNALLSAAPVVGGPLSVIVSDVAHRRDRRLAEAIAELESDFTALGHQLDEAFVRTDEFTSRFERVAENLVDARQAAKRRLYVRALRKLASVERPEVFEWDLLNDALDRLRPIHLRLLAVVAQSPIGSPTQFVRPGQPQRERLSDALPGVSTEILYRSWQDLAAVDLVDGFAIVTDDAGIASGPDDTSDGVVLTVFGRLFVDFLELGVEWQA